MQAINLIPQNTPRQIDLFTDVERIEKYERLDLCIEEIRRHFGKDSIRNGVLCTKTKMPPARVEITVGGTGIRYTVLICGQESFLFDEENGKWFVEAKV